MTVRVGLQFGAPGGEYPCGAWVLDLPGCFVAADHEGAALREVPEAIRRYRDFLSRHGIAGPPEPYGEIEVVERFQCFWSGPNEREAGQYEVDPTFIDDDGAVTADEVRFARALLLAVRPELLAAAEVAAPGRPGDRSVEDLLNHVANAEWWYCTRLEESLEPYQRFERRDEPSPRKRLAAVRDWTLARLEALPSRGAIQRIHRGERWTPRKVLRRQLYHELDHLLELRSRAPQGVR